MDYKSLKDAIKAVIKKNGAQEITGQIMQDTLLSIVSKLGGNKTFAGVATPTTRPDMTDSNIFYIAGENGTYVNFGGAKIDNEAAVFVQTSGGTWRTIYTGIQTSHGVNNQLQQEHEYFETAIDRVSADLTQFKQTEFSDVKEDVALNKSEIAKNKASITKINGEIATLNEATNTAADELVRIENKVDANLKDAVVIFIPSTNTGIYKGADILSFTNDTPTSAVTAYMSQYWDKLVKLASGKISGSVYAESNNANCTGGKCIGGTQFGYLKIEIEDYQKGGIAGEFLVLSFENAGKYTEMSIKKEASTYHVERRDGMSLLKCSSDMYDLFNISVINSFINVNSGGFTRSSLFHSLLISVKKLKKFKIRYYLSGVARCALLDKTLNIVHSFPIESDEAVETDVDAELYPNAEYLWYSTHSFRRSSSYAIAMETKTSLLNDVGYVENNLYDLSNEHFIDGAKYSKEITSVEDANFNAMYTECSCIDYLVINGGVNDGKSEVFVKNNDGSVSNVSFYTPDSPKTSQFIISLKPLTKRQYFVYNNNKENAERPVVRVVPTDNIYKILSKINSSLSGSNGALSIYSDGVTRLMAGEEILPNDEYAPINEVQTLEEKPRYKNFAYYLAKRNKLQWHDFAFDKATLTECNTKAVPDLSCILADDAIISMTDNKPDYITLWYGLNDAKYNPIMQRELWLKEKYKADIAYPMNKNEVGKEGYATAEQKAEVDKAVGIVGEVEYNDADSYFFAKFVGTENDEGLTTWCGALNYVFPLLMSEYPAAKIMIIVPDHELHGELLRKATIRMAEKWGVLHFDLNTLPYWYGSEKTKFVNTQHKEMSWLLASGETAEPTVEGFNKSRYSYDGVRPSDLGHKVISFPIGNKLING